MRFALRQAGLADATHQFDAMKARATDLRPVLEDMGEHMINMSIPETFRAGGRPGAWPRSAWSSQRQQQDSGRMLQSVRFDANTRRLEVGTNLRYAAQRHFGGEIKAKGKYLAVPLATTPRTMRRPSRWGDRLRVVFDRNQKVIGLGVRAGRKGKRTTKLIFWLKKSVTQPARPFVVFQDEDLTWFSARLGTHMAAS